MTDVPEDIQIAAQKACAAIRYPYHTTADIEIIARALLAERDRATAVERERWMTGEMASSVEISEELSQVIGRMPPPKIAEAHLSMRNVMLGLTVHYTKSPAHD